jgi:hypothetical protein
MHRPCQTGETTVRHWSITVRHWSITVNARICGDRRGRGVCGDERQVSVSLDLTSMSLDLVHVLHKRGRGEAPSYSKHSVGADVLCLTYLMCRQGCCSCLQGMAADVNAKYGAPWPAQMLQGKSYRADDIATTTTNLQNKPVESQIQDCMTLVKR